MAYTFIIAFGLSSLIALNQKDASDIYTKYQNQAGVISMSFSKEMLDGIDLDFDWKEKMMCAKGDFKSARMMVFSSEKADSNLFEMVRDEFRSIGFKYLEIKEENEVKGHLFIEKKAKRIKEVHFVSGGKSEGIVISFYGDVEVTDKK